MDNKIEVVATNSNSLMPVARWMEQLFPESEGHKGHGMWISPSLYSEKLHANGQMVQDGERNILETFLLLERHDNSINIPVDKENIDGLNFIPDKGHDMNYVNRKVIEGPAWAHYLGGVRLLADGRLALGQAHAVGLAAAEATLVLAIVYVVTRRFKTSESIIVSELKR